MNFYEKNESYKERIIELKEENISLFEDLKNWKKLNGEKNRQLLIANKQIDLMARAFKQDDVRSVEEIKQFYERKVEVKQNNNLRRKNK